MIERVGRFEKFGEFGPEPKHKDMEDQLANDSSSHWKSKRFLPAKPINLSRN